MLVTAELYRKAGARTEPSITSVRRGSTADVIGLVATNQAEVIAAGAGLGFVGVAMWLSVAVLSGA